MGKTEITGILSNPDGFLWLIQFTQGQNISAGIEEFEGKLVKVTRAQDKIVIEVIKEVEPISVQARELCFSGGYK